LEESSISMDCFVWRGMCLGSASNVFLFLDTGAHNLSDLELDGRAKDVDE
jgi:hypothetical protein